MGTTAAPRKHHLADATPMAASTANMNQHAPSLPRVLPPARTRLTLERVLGVTSLSNAMLAVNPVTGEIAYAAGCIVVIYNLRRNKQVRYYRVEKSVACLCFSPSGQFLAIGEKGYLPAITIWDGADGTLCAELQRHKYGVACMAFSRDGAYLVSVGLVHDQHLYAWDLARDATTGRMKGAAVGVATVEEKVVAMDYCHEGNFFVTAGEKHFKYWFLDAENRFLTTGYEVESLPEIQGRSAVMATKDDATFNSVGCGFGPSKLKTFAVTADGTLCSFGVSCVMERLVSLETTHGNALAVSEAYIAVGGSSSVVRLFDPSTLEYKATMPFPPAFGKAGEQYEPILNADALQPEPPHRYPATIGVRLTGSHLMALYSDRSLFIYDIADPQDPKIDRSFLFHSGSIRDLKIAGRLRGVNAKGKLVYSGVDGLHARKAKSEATIPHGAFVTCSDDNTIRFWHLDAHKPTKSSRYGADSSSDPAEMPENEPWKNPLSQEMLDIIYHDNQIDFEDEGTVVLGGTCAWDDLPDIHTPSKDVGPVNGLRGVALHPSLNAIAAGDKSGSVTLHLLPLAETTSVEIGGYSSEIHCVAFGEISVPIGSKQLIAAGGRDRLVHVHDSSKGFASVATLDNHSGAITAIHFTHDGRKLISCGADKNVVFSEVSSDGKISRYNSVPFTGGKIFDIALTSDDEHLIASSNNRLDIVSMSTGKHVRTLHVGEQHRIDICPANFCAAMSGSLTDKTINIVDLQSGETLADGTGHGEVITGIKFTPDCRRLVTTSSDGCIFVWRLAEELQSAIKSRLRRVTDTMVVSPPAPPPQPIEKQKTTASAPSLMPPPAPPVLQAKRVPPPSKAPEQLSRKLQSKEMKADVKKQTSEEVESREQTKPDASRGWKGKAKAIPGPMANVPIEDWMRTRESAKKTTHVDDQSANTHDQLSLPQGGIQVDRSKTPDWAKTFQAPKKSPEKAVMKPKSKWSQRAGAPANIQRDESERGHQSPTQDDETDGLLDLSIASMDVSQSALLGGASLALEREQLEKRKKQVETAKAVTEMNDRLSKLGLLKPQKDRQVLSPTLSAVDAEAEATQVKAANTLPPPAPITADIATEDHSTDPRLTLDGIPAEMFESIEVPISTLPNRQESHRRTVKSSTDVRADQSMSSFTNGFAIESSTTANEIAVDQSLSVFSAGYKAAGPQRKDASSAVDTSQTILSRAEVGASLSQFTDGFKAAAPINSPPSTVRDSINLSSVSASMSTFTSGYADNATKTKLPVTKSLDMRSVTESLSSFTSGYVTPSEDPSVTQSLSSFTSGFSAPVKVSPVRSSITNLRVDESLSAFTSGYSGSEAVAQPEVAASFSSFTCGYSDGAAVETTQQAVPTKPEPPVEPTVVEKKAAVLSSISDLDQQLLLTAQVLKSMTPHGENDTEVEEIRSLMGKLGLAIQRFASKR